MSNQSQRPEESQHFPIHIKNAMDQIRANLSAINEEFERQLDRSQMLNKMLAESVSGPLGVMFPIMHKLVEARNIALGESNELRAKANGLQEAMGILLRIGMEVFDAEIKRSTLIDNLKK